MKRKQQVQEFKKNKAKLKNPTNNESDSDEDNGNGFIPKTLGKMDPALNKMSKQEIDDIHKQHKRDLSFAQV